MKALLEKETENNKSGLIIYEMFKMMRIIKGDQFNNLVCI